MKPFLWSRIFLGLNAGFSILTGLALIFMPEPIVKLMFLEDINWMTTLFVAAGGGLIIFALGLIFLIRDKLLTKPKVMAIAAADVGWVVSSCVVLLLFNDTLTLKGVALISGVGFVIAVFAAGQVLGTRASVVV